MITEAQLAEMKEGTPVSYGPYGHVFYSRVVTERDNGTAYNQPHVEMKDSKGDTKLVFKWLFMQHANQLSE